MYIPRQFTPPDLEWVVPFIEQNGFALLTASIEKDLRAVHIPIQIDTKKQVLSGHVARGNNISEAFNGQTSLLAVFMHQHAYISSSWYNHLNVPTWNYISVHINGKAREISNNELKLRLEQMVDQYENGREKRFHLSDMNDEMIQRQIRGIVGFEMRIDTIQAKYKLSQNRSQEDYDEIIRQLGLSEDPLAELIAKDMRALRPE